MKFTVFYGSVREGRLGLRAAKYIVNLLKAKNHDVFFYDPVEKPFPLMQKPYHHYENPTEAPKCLRDLHHEVVTSDAIIVVSAEYNHSMPPALTNVMDHLPISAFRTRPCGIVTYSYGPFGGVRAAMQLRSFLGELGMVTPGYIFAIPEIHKAFTEEGEPLTDYMRKGGETLLMEVEWYAEALKNQRLRKPLK